jgi:16S rRNA (cytosine1402-N4)-methyltransferase
MAMDDASPRPPRRPRYNGKHPRQFADKYKELQPQKYAAEVEKIVKQGKTPAGTHRPIMVDEVLSTLAIMPGQTVLDCTLGYGGHAQVLLLATQPGGRLLGVDADPIEFPKTELRLKSLGLPSECTVLRRMNFAGIAPFLAEHAPDGVDAIFADLGISSMQIDDPLRGFSFKTEGPLDMRMNPRSGQSASDLLTKLDVEQLSAILVHNADEPEAREIATAILKAQSISPLTTTEALVSAICQGERRSGSKSNEQTLRRVFQALRIAVNEEFRWLDSFLKQVPQFLKTGGRLAILTFHSGEDRRVKASFQTGLENGTYSVATDQVTRPTATEQFSNARSRSAKLRLAIRSHHSQSHC